MTTRAMDPLQKEARRQSILDAAWHLLQVLSFPEISMNKVAKEAKLAKGTLYLYFKTKEEIFLALLESQYIQWFAYIHTALKSGGRQEDLVGAIVDFAGQRPHFLRLASSSHSVLEQNLAYEVARDYKLKLSSQLAGLAEALEQHFDWLPNGQGARLLMQSYAQLLGAWQASDLPPIMEEVIENEQLSHLHPDFKREATMALNSIWDGFKTLKRGTT